MLKNRWSQFLNLFDTRKLYSCHDLSYIQDLPGLGSTWMISKITAKVISPVKALFGKLPCNFNRTVSVLCADVSKFGGIGGGNSGFGGKINLRLFGWDFLYYSGQLWQVWMLRRAWLTSVETQCGQIFRTLSNQLAVRCSTDHQHYQKLIIAIPKICIFYYSREKSRNGKYRNQGIGFSWSIRFPVDEFNGWN